jgi:chromosomal replication initiation ATPase DnaA
MNAWDEILDKMRQRIPEEDYRRWFGATAYASDSGDQLTIWVPTEAIRRHIAVHYENALDRELKALGRSTTLLRFVVSGETDEEDEE